MPELGDEMSRYVDTIAPPISLDEVRRIPELHEVDRDALGGADRPRTGMRAIALVAAIALLVVVAIGIRARGDGDVRVGDEPTTSTGAADLGWLTPGGPESPTPSVPAGWSVMDVDSVRFAVPSDWMVPISRSCAILGTGGPPVTGLVLLPEDPATSSTCDPEPTLPPSMLTFGSGDGVPADGAPTTIGTLDATTAATCSSAGCPRTFRLADGLLVSATGPDADAVLATFTDSGAHRSLQEGPVAPRDGWMPVTFEGVAFDVPADWRFLDLPGSWTRSTTKGGSSSGGFLAPGSCAQPMFRPEGQVTVGELDGTPSCPAPHQFDIRPGNGAWIRPITDDRAAETGAVATAGEIGGLDVMILSEGSPLQQDPNPTVEAIIRNGSATYQLSIGTSDPSVVRSLLQSLRAT